MRILAIETSCDETALAIVKASGRLNPPVGGRLKFKVLKNIVSSQTAIHAHWGGVVPNLAKREHLRNLPILLRQIAKSKEQIDLLAVTVGPGLEPALWTGVNFAKDLHENLFPKAKLIGANHLEGHLYSFLLAKKTGIFNSQFPISKLFPAIALIVSGGHTILLLMKSMTNWKKLGETRDDAVGEAFDKVARMLRLPYPGGPQIEKLAKRGDPGAINFPRPMINTKNYDFSFSGLKTSVLYHLRDNFNIRTSDVLNIKTSDVQNIAASFQQAAIDVLVHKTLRAAKEFGAKSIMLSGGVASNKRLRKALRAKSKSLKMNFLSADKKFQTDNAVMIAVAAYIQHLKRKNRKISAQANLNL